MNKRVYYFVFATFATLFLKLALAATGHNYDVDSYRIVVSLLKEHKSVYANTSRYNYGPVWAYFLLLADFIAIHLPPGPECFHVVVTSLLSLFDCGISILLWRYYSFSSAVLYLASPVTILITGYHSQFEALALFQGLCSWILIRSGDPSPRRLWTSTLLLGSSLATKHILLLFPAWLLFWAPLGPFWRRLIYASAAYTVFAVLTVPWLLQPGSLHGLIDNVIRYRSDGRFSLWSLIGPGPIRSAPQAPPLPLTIAWLTGLFFIGLALRKHNADRLSMYLLALFSLSPALYDQYLMNANLAVAILWRQPVAWSLLINATGVLLFSANNVIARSSFSPVYVVLLPSTQILAAALLTRTTMHLSRNLVTWESPRLRQIGLFSSGAAVLVLLIRIIFT